MIEEEETKEAEPCKLNRACTYDCSNQGFNQICVLLSIINTLAHNICTEMGWTTIEYRKSSPFDLKTTCEIECSDNLLSYNCKCCLLRIYIRIIILEEFPTIIKQGANLVNVITFVNNYFNELLLSTNLRKTLEEHLSGYWDERIVDVFKEIKDSRNSITFDKFYIRKGILYNSSSNRINSRDLKSLLKDNDLYAIFDDHSPQFLNFLLTNSKDPPVLDPSLNQSIQGLQSILCGNDQAQIDDFMTVYLRTKMKKTRTPISDVFSSLEEQVKEDDTGKPNNTIGHAMVLKCIFSYNGKDWVYFKNSWGTKIGFNGEHVAPLEVFLDCRIYLPRFLQLTPDKFLERKRQNLDVAIQRLEKEEGKIIDRIKEREIKGKQIEDEVQRYEETLQNITPPVAQRRKRGHLGSDSLALKQLKPNFGGNRLSDKVRSKKSRRSKMQKRRKTLKRRYTRKTKSKI